MEDIEKELELDELYNKLCKLEENKEVEFEEFEETEGKLYTEEQVLAIIDEILPTIQINTEELNDIKIDMGEYIRGIKETSFMCGQFVALRNVGLDSTQAYNIVLNESTSRASKEIEQIKFDKMDY